MCIEFLKNVQVHENKEWVDEYHLDKLIPINKAINCLGIFIEKQIDQSWKQKQKLLAEK